MRITASAPAKLVLIGEYAVLEGAPALVAAVDREVRVTLVPADAASWHVRSDLGGGCAARLVAAEDGTLGAPEDWLRPIAAVIERVAARMGRRPADLPAFDITIESAQLYLDEGETKLGLGSSAAVVTALGAALQLALADEAGTPAASFEDEVAAHRAAQGGGGSGVDVAASVFGGVLAYRLGPEGPSVESLRLPGRVQFAVIWTGVPTSTPDFLGRLRAWRTEDPEAYAAHLAHMGELSARAVEACRTGAADTFLAMVRAYREAMRALGEAAGLPIVSPAHAEIAALTEPEGVAYKPSGAGGGDVGVLFAETRTALVQAGRRAERAGYRLLDLCTHPAGVTVRRRETQAP